MSISVVCPGCKVRFNVNEKFAGKKGPCPKCKVVITIPMPVQDEIKIHAPEEFASGGKDKTGRPVNKPIARVETKVKPMGLAIVVAGVVIVLAGSVVLRFIDN